MRAGKLQIAPNSERFHSAGGTNSHFRFRAGGVNRTNQTNFPVASALLRSIRNADPRASFDHDRA